MNVGKNSFSRLRLAGRLKCNSNDLGVVLLGLGGRRVGVGHGLLSLVLELAHDIGVHHQAPEEVLQHIAVDAVGLAHLHAHVRDVEHQEHVERPADVGPLAQPVAARHAYEDDPQSEPHGHQRGVQLGADAVAAVQALGGGVHGDEGREHPLDERGDARRRAVAGRLERREVGGAGVEQVEDVQRVRGPRRGAHDVVLALVDLERTPQGGAQDAQRDGVGQAGADAHGAQRGQRVVAARLEQRRGHRALGEGPEDLLNERRVGQPLRGQHVVHVRAAVGGGDEVEADADHHQEDEQRRHRLVRLHDVEHAVAVVAACQGVVPLGGEGQGGGGRGLPDSVPQVGAVDLAVAPVHVVHRAQSQLRHALHLDAQRAEHHQPEEREHDGGEEASEDELPDGASAGDAGNEHADEGRPADPPAPVEHGPPIHELRGVGVVQRRLGEDAGGGVLGQRVGRLHVVEQLGAAGAPQQVLVLGVLELVLQLLEGVALEPHLDDPLEVVPGGLHVRVEQVPRVVQEHQGEQQEEPDGEGDIGERLDAALEAHGDGHGGDDGDDPDDDDLVVNSHLNGGVELMQAVVDGADAEAEGGAHAEGGARDGQGVDEVAERGVDEVAEQRVEGAAHGQRHVPAVAHDGERHRHDNVHHPAVQAPVEQRGEDGLLRAVVVVVHGDLPQRVAVAGAVVVHGLGHAPVVDAHSDTAGEEHGEPRDVVELGLLVGAAQAERAVLGEADVEQEERPDVLGADVQPGEVLGDPRLPHLGLGEHLHGLHERRDGEAPQDDGRHQRRHPV
mmetsp:Transcript_5263/g.13395  ORF Transcript_5263/g.13395 Transcript_5263/m.13395 type:complete len:786 (-) Transcript_5263:249-2606(-)